MEMDVGYSLQNAAPRLVQFDPDWVRSKLDVELRTQTSPIRGVRYSESKTIANFDENAQTPWSSLLKQPLEPT